MYTHRLKVTIEDQRLFVDLPADFPRGPAEVTVRPMSSSRKVVRAGDALASGSPMPAGDPIDKILRELREERVGRLERLADKLGSDADS